MPRIVENARTLNSINALVAAAVALTTIIAPTDGFARNAAGGFSDNYGGGNGGRGGESAGKGGDNTHAEEVAPIAFIRPPIRRPKPRRVKRQVSQFDCQYMLDNAVQFRSTSWFRRYDKCKNNR